MSDLSFSSRLNLAALRNDELLEACDMFVVRGEGLTCWVPDRRKGDSSERVYGCSQNMEVADGRSEGVI